MGSVPHYAMQADKALVRKYGSTWWRRVKYPGAVVRRIEERIYQHRKRLADRCAILAASVAGSLIGVAILRLWQ